MSNEWVGEAICARTPKDKKDWWFLADSDSREGRLSPENRAALDMCASCPVAAECLTDALRRNVVDTGIYGGVTPRERRDLDRRLWAPPAATRPGVLTWEERRAVLAAIHANRPAPRKRAAG